MFGIRRPTDRGERVVISLRAIEAQRKRFSFAFGAKEDVVVLDESFPFSIGRSFRPWFLILRSQWWLKLLCLSLSSLLGLSGKINHAVEDVVIIFRRRILRII